MAPTPQDRITDYLGSHRTGLQFSTLDAVVQQVKLSVFYGMSPLSDDEIRKVVSQWAMFNAVGLLLKDPPGASSAPSAPRNPAAANSDSNLVAAVRKAVTAISDGVTIGRKDVNINLGVTGPTANLKRGNSSISIGGSWTGTLKIDANSGPFHFSGSLSTDSWSITLSFPQDTYIPDLSSVTKVFTEGYAAVGQIAQATAGLTSVSDVGRVGALVKPQLDKVQKAVDAAQGIYNAKRGFSFGFNLENAPAFPGQQGMPSGVQGGLVFSYVF